MKKLYFIIITIVLILVLLVAEVVVVKSLSKYEPEIAVIYAGKSIPAKTVITAGMLRLLAMMFIKSWLRKA